MSEIDDRRGEIVIRPAKPGGAGAAGGITLYVVESYSGGEVTLYPAGADGEIDLTGSPITVTALP